ncbi:TatD family hydrolase [Acholeplasma hippikon]|uniref:TatD family deoxyribonuclease n=1 Tax=Acholeplasma hippikon TaxID=264636 RepID=A0A449BKP7_9MOLU|nr:TatD family hydrolase [Acholeplasma hippikon]VEU82907.1 TatD family deoxyribonuclease [Acholeplasma hippikon]
MMIDTHAHLNTDAYKEDLDEVISRADLYGVKKIIVIGMDKYHNEKAVELANNYANLYATVGVHPCDVETEKIEDIIPLLDKNKVVALGEIGIDLYWNKDNLAKQIIYFKEQLDLAVRKNIPVIIHTRESFKEAYDVVKEYKGKLTGVFHAFSSTLDDAKKAIDLGFYIGIGGVVTFNKRGELEDIVKNIPLEKIIVETDSPYLTPKPFRGKRNEPGYTKFVVEEIAKIKNITIEEVSKITTNNANALFRLE